MTAEPASPSCRLMRARSCQQANACWLLNFSSIAPFGYDVLATLRHSGLPYALSPGDLMASTMVTSGTMTHRIDQLDDLLRQFLRGLEHEDR